MALQTSIPSATADHVDATSVNFSDVLAKASALFKDGTHEFKGGTAEITARSPDYLRMGLESEIGRIVSFTPKSDLSEKYPAGFAPHHEALKEAQSHLASLDRASQRAGLEVADVKEHATSSNLTVKGPGGAREI